MLPVPHLYRQTRRQVPVPATQKLGSLKYGLDPSFLI
jgi:hypothetical protein